MIEYQSLPTPDPHLDPRYELIATARNFYHQGWMMGTAGNLSIAAKFEGLLAAQADIRRYNL